MTTILYRIFIWILVTLYKIFDIFLLWNHWLDWVRINFRSIQWANSTLFNIHEIFQNGSEFQWSKFPILWIWRRAADLQTIFREDLQSSILKEIIPCMLLLAKVNHWKQPKEIPWWRPGNFYTKYRTWGSILNVGFLDIFL